MELSDLDYEEDVDEKSKPDPVARFKERLSSCALVAVAIVTALFTIRGNTQIVWMPFIFFSVLFVVSIVREVFVTVGEVDIGMSTISATISGAAVVFYWLDAPLPFVLAILTTVIYPTNIKKRQWALLAFNVSNDVIAGCAVYGLLHLLNFSIDQNLMSVVFKVFLATCAYEVVNYTVLAIDSAFRGEEWRELLYDLRRSLIEVLPLAMFSGLLGVFYFRFGPGMLLFFVVPLFLGRELSSSYAEMADTQRTTITTLIKVLEAKDKYTAGHVERVAMFAKYIGQELGYGPRKLERLRQAALLHDAGKLIVPSNLLNKPGKLTDAEFKIIQRHEFVTIEVLQAIDFLAPIAVTAGGDHNKMESTKVPKRKLEPYIVSVCDAFDAMTSTRSYRKALKMEVAFEEMHSKEGKQFHPVVVNALINAIESRGEHYGDGYETDIVHTDAPEAGIGSAGIGDLEDEEDAESKEVRTFANAQDDINAVDGKESA